MLMHNAIRNTQYAIYLLGFSFILSGCVVRSYPVTRDRVDQDLSGNRGYLQGEAPEIGERKPTRTTRVVEIELHPALKFDKAPKHVTQEANIAQRTDDEGAWGNRGFVQQGGAAEIAAMDDSSADVRYEKYTVQKGDTLQKISKKLYGTTKRWNKIFQANSDVLKSPDKIYPGQVINVPAESRGKFK